MVGVVTGDPGPFPYGFDLTFKTVWNHEMFAWCTEMLGPPADVDPDAAWSRIWSRDILGTVNLRFARIEDAVAFRFRFL